MLLVKGNGKKKKEKKREERLLQEEKGKNEKRNRKYGWVIGKRNGETKGKERAESNICDR